jgi:hypothetical protein
MLPHERIRGDVAHMRKRAKSQLLRAGHIEAAEFRDGRDVDDVIRTLDIQRLVPFTSSSTVTAPLAARKSLRVTPVGSDGMAGLLVWLRA